MHDEGRSGTKSGAVRLPRKMISLHGEEFIHRNHQLDGTAVYKESK